MKGSELNDKKALTLFNKKVQELRKAKIIKTKKKCYSYQIHFNSSNDNLDFYNLPLPPEEFIESYLLRFRHFLLNKSPINIFHILNVAYRLAEHEKDKESIALLRKEISTILYGKFPEVFKPFIVSNNTDDLFKLFLNGKYFHLDHALKNKLESLELDNYKANMLAFLIALYSFSVTLFLTELLLEKIFDPQIGHR